MENLLVEILQSIYTADIKKLRETWHNLKKNVLNLKINKENFLFQFQYQILAQALGTCLKEDTEEIKSKITLCIQYMLELSEYTTVLKEFIETYCEHREGNAKLEMDAFKQLSQTGICEDKEHYSFALYYLSAFTYERDDDSYIFSIDPAFCSIVSFAAWFSQGSHILEIHLSDYVLGFFYEFCEQETITKRFFYTDREIIEKRLSDFQNRDVTISERIMRNHSFNEVYEWIHFYEMFDCNNRSYTILRLFEKVFLNKSIVIQSSKNENDEIDKINKLFSEKEKIIGYYSDDAYESAPQLFGQVRDNVTNLDRYPGFVIMLYMLCKEFSLEQFFLVFPEKKPYDMRALEKYEWNLIPEVLGYHNANKGIAEYYDKIFEYYEEDLLKLYSKVSNDFSIIDKNAYNQYTKNSEILNMLLYFCAWENVSYAMKDIDNFHGDIEEYHKTQILTVPFFDACAHDKWREKETITRIFNRVAEILCFTNPSHTFDDFKINTEESNLALVMLIYNLSRTEIEARAAMKEQINFLREIQRQKLPLERSKANLAEAKINQEKMKKIDKGFKLNNFITQIYPFCGSDFQNYFEEPQIFFLRRDFLCKFACETDTVYYPDQETVTNYRETNRLGFSVRYLYKDRNMSTHHVRHSSVDNLMKTTNWRNLLYAFSDIEKNLSDLLEETEKDYYQHPITSLKPEKNPKIFVIYYLMKENQRLYNEFIAKLYKAANLLHSEPEITLYTYEQATDSFRDNSENIIKKIESKFDLTNEKTIKKSNEEFVKRLSYSPNMLNCNSNDKYQQRENLFELRLERLLNIMFAVNGNNENGFEHNLTMYDFFRRYHAEIAFYLIYLTGEFSKL